MSRTAKELAEHLGLEIEGDLSATIIGVAGPESAAEQDLIYVDSAKHAERAAASRAKCAIAPPGVRLAGKTLLRAAHAKLAFAKAAAWLLPPPQVAKGVHGTAVIAPSARLARSASVGPYAVIEEDAEVGEGSEIGAHSFIGRAAKIGENCRLFPRVTLYPGVWLGSRVIVHSGAVIGSDGFGYVQDQGRHWKFPQVGGVEIDDDVEIGANTTIDRGSLGVTRIGAGVKIDNLVQVAHNVEIGEHSVIAAQVGISGSCVIGKRVVLAGQAGLGEHCRLEDDAVIGGQAGILPGKKVRRGTTVWGTPARLLVEFKEQFCWFARLPELGERVKRLEENAQSR